MTFEFQMASRLRRVYLISFVWCVLASGNRARAGSEDFTNELARAQIAANHGDVAAAVTIYGTARRAGWSNCASLCVLARRYCDLMYLTNPVPARKDLLARALDCSLQAVTVDPSNGLAHACAAVCYAKECGFADLKAQLNFARLFKAESEQAIALDPKQDIAYYLLGRWNYELANVGLLSRAYVKVIYGGLPRASNAAAIANFKKAVELAPDRIMNHSGLAMVYATTGQTDLEVAELKKCLATKPLNLEDRDSQVDAAKKLAALGR